MNPRSTEALAAALAELRQRRAEIEVLRAARYEPIAIVGMACRFPGDSDTPQKFWQLLQAGRDAIVEIPRDRWEIDQYYDPDPSTPGKMSVRSGGFLSHVHDFDAAFFNISPREATYLDPQQRLLLEVAWEAIENANIASHRLRESSTGVYVGITCFDHAIEVASDGGRSSSYLGTGSALNMAAGRLSFALGLTGPSMAIDTACSSSLVCLHLACESLRSGESRMALAGGVNLMLSPEVMVSFSQARMLAPDGRCKTFDADADGYVRGEGCGMVLLKRLSEAMAEGDRILGVIRGTAVDHGGASGGLTIPSRNSQVRVIRRALQQAGISPSEVSYVEAHGTGTSLGDPIEMEALAEVFGAREHWLMTGSVKTNIGHLESASGIAGLIKVLLAFQHEQVPAHLNFQRPNPHIPWNDIPVRVTAEPFDWPRGAVRRIAGISAFGFSGTNAHVVVEDPPAGTPSAGTVRTVLPVSARSSAALQALEHAYEAIVRETGEHEIPALCRAAAAGRNHYAHRLAHVLPHGPVYRSAAQATSPRTAFVLAGAPEAWVKELHTAEPAFRQAFDRYAQTEAFAAWYAWVELWKSWGVRASAFLGTGAGAYVAACQAQAIPVEDALLLFQTGPDPSELRDILPRIRISPASAALMPGAALTDPEYWLQQKTTAASCKEIQEVLRALPAATLIPSPRAGKALERSVAWLYAQGQDLDWPAFFGTGPQPASTLPNYPFQRQRFQLPTRSHQRNSSSGDLYYQVQWEAAPTHPATPRARADEDTWLLIPGEANNGESFAALLQSLGCSVQVLAGFASFPVLEPRTRVIFFGDTCELLLRVAQQMLRAPDAKGSKLWCIPRDAVDAGDVPALTGLAQSPLWGMAKGISIEHPEIFGAAIDLDREASSGEDEMLLTEILSGSREDQVALRDGRLFVPRLVRTHGQAASPLRVDADSLYLITGGLGQLGSQTANWLIGRGARTLLLTGRRPPEESILASLRRHGAEVRYEQIDVTDASAVSDLFRRIREEYPPLKGIVHAAGILGYEPLEFMEPSTLAAVLRPKVEGAWLLHRESQSLNLDFFLLYSSIASAWGSNEQAHYNAANRYLDSLAHYRHARGLPAMSINWGPWTGGGMTSPEAATLLSRIGVRCLTPECALEALHFLPTVSQLAIADIDWHQFQRSYEARGFKAFLDHIRAEISQPREPESPERAENESFTGDRKSLVEALEKEAAHVLGFDSGRLDRDLGFFEMGMDSLLALEFRSRIEKSLGLSVPATLLFDSPSIHTLADSLLNGKSASVSAQEDIRVPEDNLKVKIELLSEEEAEVMLVEKLKFLN